MATLSWHPRLPAPPEEFPSKVDFALSREEAEFIRDRIQVACPNSLLSFLVLHCEPADTHAPWALKKTDTTRMNTVVYTLLETIRVIGTLLQPFIPDAADKMQAMIGRQGDDFAKTDLA